MPFFAVHNAASDTGCQHCRTIVDHGHHDNHERNYRRAVLNNHHDNGLAGRHHSGDDHTPEHVIRLCCANISDGGNRH